MILSGMSACSAADKGRNCGCFHEAPRIRSDQSTTPPYGGDDSDGVLHVGPWMSVIARWLGRAGLSLRTGTGARGR
jgi:hypothetical protein